MLRRGWGLGRSRRSKLFALKLHRRRMTLILEGPKRYLTRFPQTCKGQRCASRIATQQAARIGGLGFAARHCGDELGVSRGLTCSSEPLQLARQAS